jgi:hypothetical protein
LIGAEAGSCDGWIRVVPGDPDASLLHAKLAGDAPCGDPMPIGGAPLDGTQLTCIADWISGLEEEPPCETCGGEACVDLMTDPDHCGECDSPCPDGILCESGECSCPEGTSLCGDQCINLASDPANCGECGESCVDPEVCLEGVCTSDCGDLEECGGACVDLQTDPMHCGECDNACDPGNACIGGGCDCPGDGVSFAIEVQPIFTNNCANMACHGNVAPKEGLKLVAGSSWASLVDVPSNQCAQRSRVAPGDSNSSYLIDKLQGLDMCFGTRMPKASPALSGEEMATISEWICRGALDD